MTDWPWLPALVLTVSSQVSSVSADCGWPSVLPLPGMCSLPAHTLQGLPALQGSEVSPLFTVERHLVPGGSWNSHGSLCLWVQSWTYDPVKLKG